MVTKIHSVTEQSSLVKGAGDQREKSTVYQNMKAEVGCVRLKATDARVDRVS